LCVRGRVGVATGGYTAPSLHDSLKHQIFPVLSNSIVTRPMTAEEKRACNFITSEVITDTRTLRFYYRKLPDDRIQIGSRSAITGGDAAHPRHHKLLVDTLHRKFPALQGIDVDYSWWGWVDVSHDMMPHIFQPNPQDSIYYAMGYRGIGGMDCREVAEDGSADFLVPAAWPRVRAVPAARPAHALPVVLPAGRDAMTRRV
jgi:glycine/D-amino acid oxidase-like deaminating enzyme